MKLITFSIAVVAIICGASGIGAQVTKPTPPDTAVQIKGVKITAPPAQARVSPMQALTMPNALTLTASKVQQSINLVDPEDAVKYLPSVFLRKRNFGDTQATMETRVWGVSSSARSLIFADGVPLTALVANNNTIGGPRWGLVSPEEIARIDMMYGPFSAAYAGNSMGAVMEITTRQPDSLVASIEQVGALQHFDLYGTNRSFGTSQTNATLGDRFGKFSFWASGNYQNSQSQPLLYVTSASFPTGTSGGFAESNKLGAPANVLGATGLLHTGMTNARAKLAYDFTPNLRAAYSFGVWRNDANAGVDSYLDRGTSGTFAGQSGFASGYYDLLENHTSHSLSLRTRGGGDWDFEGVGTLYRFDKDQQRTPSTVSSTDETFSTPGKIAVLDGTGWETLDLKASWHRGSVLAPHVISFGVHDDRYTLDNPTYNTTNWQNGGFGTVATEGNGKTETQALWAQDAWSITQTLKFTFGGRYEWWRAFDGLNINGGTTVVQPTVSASRFSPKGVLSWDANANWRFSASVGKAYRFATPAELYQLVSTGATFTSPDPHLKPDNDLATELRATRTFEKGTAQVALFQDDVHDAIIAQFLPLVSGSNQLFSVVSNVDHVRARGIEVSGTRSDVFTRGLELSANATYLDARTLALSGQASATAPAGSAIGKFLPNIPKWRAAFSSTYHVDPKLDLSLGGRYSSKMFTTLDNADVHTNTYQGFTEWFVMDARAGYHLDRHWFGSVGVDNLLDRKYFLFHPFPQRTFIASLKYSL
ncbi:MAG TPA: TonB-dependent receptor [Gemmatimonadaceae bacterium]